LKGDRATRRQRDARPGSVVTDRRDARGGSVGAMRVTFVPVGADQEFARVADMSNWVGVTELVANERFGLEGDEHEVRGVRRDRNLVWVDTAEGRLIPLHETERVLVLDEVDAITADPST
jgi:hypothetical protein